MMLKKCIVCQTEISRFTLSTNYCSTYCREEDIENLTNLVYELNIELKVFKQEFTAMSDRILELEWQVKTVT